MVAFRIPRFHEVTPVAAPRPRLSVFGWFLKPGKTYELYDGEEEKKSETKGAPPSRKEEKIRKKKTRRIEEEGGGKDGPVPGCKLARRIIANSREKAV